MSGNLPTLIGEIAVEGKPRVFPFVTWATALHFTYPAWAAPLLSRCESAAEAYFVRAFCERAGAHAVGDMGASTGDTVIELQRAVRLYRVDVVVHRSGVPLMALAVEIDGLGFHHQTAEQVAHDYVRDRRLVHDGFVVLRFTAAEVFRDAAACWQEIDAILDERRCAWRVLQEG